MAIEVKEKTLLEQVIGTWSLVSYQSTDKDGNVIYPLGEDAKGFIMYNPDGYMSAQIMASDALLINLVTCIQVHRKKWQQPHMVIWLIQAVLK